jgi:hypothetical protein
MPPGEPTQKPEVPVPGPNLPTPDNPGGTDIPTPPPEPLKMFIALGTKRFLGAEKGSTLG